MQRYITRRGLFYPSFAFISKLTIFIDLCSLIGRIRWCWSDVRAFTTRKIYGCVKTMCLTHVCVQTRCTRGFGALVKKHLLSCERNFRTGFPTNKRALKRQKISKETAVVWKAVKETCLSRLFSVTGTISWYLILFKRGRAALKKAVLTAPLQISQGFSSTVLPTNKRVQANPPLNGLLPLNSGNSFG